MLVIPLPHYFISDHDWACAQKCLSCVVFSATTLPYSFSLYFYKLVKAYGKCLFFSDPYSKENALVLGSGSGKHEDHDMIQDLGFFYL